MRGIDTVVSEVINIINTIPVLRAVSNYGNSLMDTPIVYPIVAVGVDHATMQTDKMSTYSGERKGADGYSVPTKITLSADIFLPHTATGLVNYDAVCRIIAALMESDKVVSQVTCDRMYYAPTYVSTVLPVKIPLNDRICNDWGGEQLSEL